MTTEVNVIFGTETGTAEEVSHDVVRYLVSKGARCFLLSADELPLDQWQLRPTIVVCSTTGQGEFPRTISATWEILRMSDAPEMTGCRYAVFGLGDSSYAKFNFPAKMLHNRLKQLGGQPLVHRGLGNEQDGEGHEQVLRPWLSSVAAALGLIVDREVAQQPVFLHKYAIETSAESASNGETSAAATDSNLTSSAVRRTKTIPLVVVRNERLTAPEHFQSVHHIELAPSGGSTLPSYKPGDSLAVHVTNHGGDVDTLCNFVHDFRAEELLTVRMRQLDYLTAQPSVPFTDKSMSLKTLFTNFFDITSAVSRSFLRMLSAFATDAEEKERLEELSSSSRLEEYNSYCFREKRCPAEVLADFPSARPPLSALLSCLKALQPRRFSISSSHLLDDVVISLTVAKLEFVTPYGRKRQGLCSSMLCDAVAGQMFAVSLSEGKLELPEDSGSSLILVGPGTGFAPVRSILRHCAALSWTGRIHVFAGFRRKTKDFLYQDELTDFLPSKLPQLKVFTAFSRDQPAKRYVQHLMVEEPARTSLAVDLAQEHTCVFVCGNSKQMPQDVQDALRSAYEKDHHDDTEDIISRLNSEGRLFMDTWSS